jgi:uncharacterized protein YxjI
MRSCPKCGAPLSLGAQYCGQCGARTGGSQTPESVGQSSTETSVFTASEYTLEKRIVAAVSTFEIKDTNGAVVAIVKREMVPLGAAYSVETPDGSRIGELRGAVALIPNRPYVEIRDANGQQLAIIMMRVAKKPGAGFFSVGITTWVIAKPDGTELAKINWSKGGHEWTIEAPDGTMIAEAHWKWLEVPHDTYHIKIHSLAMDPYFVLATIFSNIADRANVG